MKGASRTVKLKGLKSIVHMAELTGRSREYLQKAFNDDREMFDALLEQAIKKANK